MNLWSLSCFVSPWSFVPGEGKTRIVFMIHASMQLRNIVVPRHKHPLHLTEPSPTLPLKFDTTNKK